jgi:hypothetical protein
MVAEIPAAAPITPPPVSIAPMPPVPVPLAATPVPPALFPGVKVPLPVLRGGVLAAHPTKPTASPRLAQLRNIVFTLGSIAGFLAQPPRTRIPLTPCTREFVRHQQVFVAPIKLRTPLSSAPAGYEKAN